MNKIVNSFTVITVKLFYLTFFTVAFLASTLYTSRGTPALLVVVVLSPNIPELIPGRFRLIKSLIFGN